MRRVYDRLGSWVLPRGLGGIGLENTLQYNPYEDDMQNVQSSPPSQEELEVMPDVSVQYLGAEILCSLAHKQLTSMMLKEKMGSQSKFNVRHQNVQGTIHW